MSFKDSREADRSHGDLPVILLSSWFTECWPYLHLQIQKTMLTLIHGVRSLISKIDDEVKKLEIPRSP